MDWKESLKHSLILFGITIIFGIVYFILTEIFYQLGHYLWIPTITIIIIIPLSYSIFIKKSVKELAIIAVLVILISSIITLPIMSITKNSVFKSKENRLTYMPILHVAGTNPISLIDTTICLPYLKELQPLGSNIQVEICPIKKAGIIVELIIVGIIGIVSILLSMMLGNYLLNLKNKE